MWFLTFELWPYLLGALALGLVTGWRSGCARPRPEMADEDETEVAP